jgi:hypothetical protein
LITMRSLRKQMRYFMAATAGSILVEAMLVIPVVTIFAVGVLEFGNVLWQRQQLQTGVRDAARYWSRCRPDFSFCSHEIARNLAFYGNPGGVGGLRVPNWSAAADLEIEPILPPPAPQPDDLVVVTGRVEYRSSPLFGVLLINPIVISYTHSERYIGW